MAYSRELFARLPVVGILRGFPEAILDHLVPAVLHGGLTCIEVTMNSPGAARQIESVRRLAGDAMNVGAGTVTTLERLGQALDAGASFIVTPVVVPDVIRRCRDLGIPVFPGAFTPTEIFQAWEHGAEMVKLFPANRLGPGYLKDIKAPLPEIPLLATGGVTVESLAEWRAAGADGFGVGGPLFDKQRVQAGDWAWVKAQAARFAAAWQATGQG